MCQTSLSESISPPANGAPLGLLDYERPQLLHATNGRRLITANLAARRHLFDVPIYMFRRLATELVKASLDTIRRRPDQSFSHEREALFFAGFIAKRLARP